MYDNEIVLLRWSRFLFLGALLCSGAAAQLLIDPNLNTWFSVYSENPIGDTRFTLVAHGHYRRNRILAEPQQYLIRTGLYFRPNSKFTFGGGHVLSHIYRFPEYAGPYPLDEQRAWQDFTLRTPLSKRITLTNRIRLEQRFLAEKSGPSPGTVTGHQFENRFRHLGRITFAVGKGYNLSLGNEIWMPSYPNTHPRTVEQNRPQISLGKRIHKYWRVEAMYMLQQIWQPNGRVRQDNHTMWFQLFCELPIFQKKK